MTLRPVPGTQFGPVRDAQNPRRPTPRGCGPAVRIVRTCGARPYARAPHQTCAVQPFGDGHCPRTCGADDHRHHGADHEAGRCPGTCGADDHHHHGVGHAACHCPGTSGADDHHRPGVGHGAGRCPGTSGAVFQRRRDADHAVCHRRRDADHAACHCHPSAGRGVCHCPGTSGADDHHRPGVGHGACHCPGTSGAVCHHRPGVGHGACRCPRTCGADDHHQRGADHEAGHHRHDEACCHPRTCADVHCLLRRDEACAVGRRHLRTDEDDPRRHPIPDPRTCRHRNDRCRRDVNLGRGQRKSCRDAQT